MYVNLDLYKIFYITAKSGSISKAAKELFTSQPAISQSIKQLEEKLGGQLFYRTPKGVSLTVEGEYLFRHVEPGYGLMETAERKFMELKQMSTGQLRISVCSAICKYDLLESIGQYNQRYPNIQVHIKDESSKVIARQLDLGEIDIGVLNLNGIDENKFDVIKIFQMQDCFVAGERYKSLSETDLTLQILAEEYPIIMLQKGGNTRAFLDQYFKTHGIDLVPQIELSNMDLIVEFAIKGLGIACVIKDYVQRELHRGLLYELMVKERIPPRSLGMVTKKGIPLSTAAQKYVDMQV
ncbi:LysR family transcriptional regulator [Anaerocolumna cellulosilytica]|nr:LysR family transcriptional regulator [Anaerocolumna cellulosilytica]MBB5195606.1 DNA-binding transcriptional LysR family regulator [Anaerocolumna cellulosilytica]